MEKVHRLFKEGTRKAKAEARKAVHGAFGVYLKSKFGNAGLAKCILRCGPDSLESILASYFEFKATDEYREQKRRSQQGLSDNQMQAKHDKEQAYKQWRRAKWLSEKGVTWRTARTNSDSWLLWEYEQGILAEKRRESARCHGYGAGWEAPSVAAWHAKELQP